MQAQARVRESLRNADKETGAKGKQSQAKRPAPSDEVPEKSEQPKKQTKKGGKKEPLVPPDEIFQLANASTLDATKVQDSGLDFKVSIAQLNPKPGSFHDPVLLSFAKGGARVREARSSWHGDSRQCGGFWEKILHAPSS